MALWSYAQNNRTYYYERVKEVNNGNQKTAAGDGHYITITQYGLYESDENGSTKNQGFVKFISADNNRPYYEGNAFLGTYLSYVFNSDYSRLNLHLGNGTIYVYERKSRPSSDSALRVYSSDPLPGPIPLPDPKPNPDPSPKSSPKEMDCPYCNGTGRVKITVSGGIIKNQYWITCDECGQRYLNTDRHVHRDCTYCRGTGKRRIN